MGKTTGIQWCDATWNPYIGCTKIAIGCQNCYMYRDSKRFGFDPTIVRKSKTKFKEPLKWKEPKRVFVCSYSDFWHEEADQWREEAFRVMLEAKQHTYMIPTKRPSRMALWTATKLSLYGSPFSESIKHIKWGISVSTQDDLYGNMSFLGIMPGVKFLSMEPLLEPIHLYDPFHDLSSVIVGCESGPGRRPFDNEWAINMMHQCRELGIAFIMKQMIINDKVENDISKFPTDLQIRELPQ